MPALPQGGRQPRRRKPHARPSSSSRHPPVTPARRPLRKAPSRPGTMTHLTHLTPFSMCGPKRMGQAPKPRRRRSVEPPDLAIANGDLADRVSDLRNRLGHALHLFGETVPVSKPFMFGARGDPLRAPSRLRPVRRTPPQLPADGGPLRSPRRGGWRGSGNKLDEAARALSYVNARALLIWSILMW